MADICRATAGDAGIDVVVGPTTGGVILAYEVAKNLGTRGFFAETVAAADGTSHRELRRGFRIEPGERVALVDDVVTTGASLLEMIPLIESTGGTLSATVVIVDRSGELASLVSATTGTTYAAQALWSLNLPTYEPGAETCPGCAAGIPLEAPGSSGTSSAS
jgi:orotate phosphoribosyltransferase